MEYIPFQYLLAFLHPLAAHHQSQKLRGWGPFPCLCRYLCEKEVLSWNGVGPDNWMGHEVNVSRFQQVSRHQDDVCVEKEKSNDHSWMVVEVKLKQSLNEWYHFLTSQKHDSPHKKQYQSDNQTSATSCPDISASWVSPFRGRRTSPRQRTGFAPRDTPLQGPSLSAPRDTPPLKRVVFGSFGSSDVIEWTFGLGSSQ